MAADPTAFTPATALVVVDVQNDFADPGGSLYVEGGDGIVPGINRLLDTARSGGGTVVLTQDWHPPATPHFASGGGTWPVHCVRGTWGAQLHPGLSLDADLVLRKGTGGEDGYSAFTVIDPESGERAPTGLAGYLRERSITEVVVVGIAADVCVRATALDAAEIGFACTARWDLTAAVDLEAGDGDRAADELSAAGVSVVGA